MTKKSLFVLLVFVTGLSNLNCTYGYTTSNAVVYEKKIISVENKNFTANVITVDLSNKDVQLEVTTAENALNKTASFKTIVDAKDPVAAINGNFFNAYDTVKDPIGSIMSNGQYIYASSGLTSMGITHDNKIIFGRPLVFTKITTTDNTQKGQLSWTAFEVNVLNQAGEQSVLYTPARGQSVSITNPGYVMSVENSTIQSYDRVTNGSKQTIPANGYLVYFSDSVTRTSDFVTPELGRTLKINYAPFKEDEEKFDLANTRQVVSGSPRLIKSGAICEEPLEAGFAGDSRFLTASTPRTAAGKLTDGRLVFVNVSSATIAQMKQIMLAIGCTDALNLDGGASSGMYVNGSYITTPGRELTSVILINKV